LQVSLSGKFTRIERLISQSFRLQAHLTLASLGWRHNLGECAKTYARWWACFCTQNFGGASILLLT